MRQNLLRCWSRGVICGSAALSQSSCVPKSGHFGAATEKTTRANKKKIIIIIKREKEYGTTAATTTTKERRQTLSAWSICIKHLERHPTQTGKRRRKLSGNNNNQKANRQTSQNQKEAICFGRSTFQPPIKTIPSLAKRPPIERCKQLEEAQKLKVIIKSKTPNSYP